MFSIVQLSRNQATLYSIHGWQPVIASVYQSFDHLLQLKWLVTTQGYSEWSWCIWLLLQYITALSFSLMLSNCHDCLFSFDMFWHHYHHSCHWFAKEPLPTGLLLKVAILSTRLSYFPNITKIINKNKQMQNQNNSTIQNTNQKNS